jgi:hypothetical protein
MSTLKGHRKWIITFVLVLAAFYLALKGILDGKTWAWFCGSLATGHGTANVLDKRGGGEG